VYSVPYFENSLSHLAAVRPPLIRPFSPFPLFPALAVAGSRRALGGSHLVVRASPDYRALLLLNQDKRPTPPSSVPVGVPSSPFADNDHIRDIQERRGSLVI